MGLVPFSLQAFGFNRPSVSSLKLNVDVDVDAERVERSMLRRGEDKAYAGHTRPNRNTNLSVYKTAPNLVKYDRICVPRPTCCQTPTSKR